MTPGVTEVILQVYTTEQSPTCPFDPIIGPLAVGKRYIYQGSQVRTADGINYSILSLERKNSVDPGPGLYWPEAFVKLAFGGGIS